MEKTELEAICKEILALKGVTFISFSNKEGKIVCWKSKIQPKYWPISIDEIESRSLTSMQMIDEIANGLSKYIGRLHAFILLHEKRNSIVIPVNELYLGITTEKTVRTPIIEEVDKIIKKHTR